MCRVDQFAFRVNEEEKNLIALLAKRLQRSRSDAVRFVVVNAIRELENQEQLKPFIDLVLKDISRPVR